MKALHIAAAGLAAAGTALAAIPAAAAQPAVRPPVAPPPPMVVQTIEPPMAAVRGARLAERRAVIAFDVEVRGGREVLWSGTLRVSGNMAGEYTQSKREAWSPCPGDAEGASRYPYRQNELRVSLSRRNGDGEADAFSITTSLIRPLESCGEGQGSRSVAITQVVTLAPGASRELTGDGGLSVRLTRRP